jgi:hypothetical protein
MVDIWICEAQGYNGRGSFSVAIIASLCRDVSSLLMFGHGAYVRLSMSYPKAERLDPSTSRVARMIDCIVPAQPVDTRQIKLAVRKESSDSPLSDVWSSRYKLPRSPTSTPYSSTNQRVKFVSMAISLPFTCTFHSLSYFEISCCVSTVSTTSLMLPDLSFSIFEIC